MDADKTLQTHEAQALERRYLSAIVAALQFAPIETRTA
jgi:hypothetical protein